MIVLGLSSRCQCEFWLDCLRDVPIDKVKLAIKEYNSQL